MPKEKVAILTSFTFINHGYSLTGIVEDQVRMLTSNGHEVHLFVCENFEADDEAKLFEHDPWTHLNFTLHKVIPKTDLVDYQREEDLSEHHKEIIRMTGEVLASKLTWLQIDIVFTHDFLLTGWNLPYGLGVMDCCTRPSTHKIAWFHWIHSLPNPRKDWWVIRKWGSRHKLVYPNKTDLQKIIEAYWGAASCAIAIPHIKDYRSYFEFGEDTYNFIDEFPGVMESEIVMVYPASTDRLDAKRVDKLIAIFKEFKRMKFKVCLVIANQWATGRARKQDITGYYKRVRLSKLKINKEVIFTSEWKDEFATGIPRRLLRELQLMSNLFIFPTSHESFGLVAPEAALCGVEMVYNRSLTMMHEVSGGQGIHAEFGSYEKELVTPGTEKEYYEALAHLIAGRMQRNESISCKTFNRLAYNWDRVYNKFYLPAFGESDLW
jgi:glycosyltransferase involved in cell wall biosynthesis